MAVTAGTNRAPINSRNVSPEDAKAYRDQVNAESTYNTWTNNQAFNHLKDLHYTVSMLGQHPELKNHPLFDSKNENGVHAALTGAIQHHETKNVGDVLEGERHPNGSLAYGTGSRAYVGAIKQMLGSVHHPDEGVTSLLAQAHQHADNYLNQYTPASFDTNAKNKQTTGEKGVSVIVDQPYKRNVYDYPRPKEANAEDQKAADKDWANQMKATPEGRYPKTYQYEQAKIAAGTAAKKSVKNNERQKTKRAAARAERLSGN